jgi:addiction module RelE/StbE family toxin
MNTIHWTESAQNDYLSMLSTIYNHSTDAAIALDESLENLLERLRQFKYLCPPLGNVNGLRRCVVNSSVALVYDVSGNTLTILSVFDTRSEHRFN